MAEKKSNRGEPFSEYYKRMEVPARTILLGEGEVSKHAYFIEKGCMRAWFNNNGKDVTFQFFFENQGVASIESFRTGRPSLFNIETIEPCVIQRISKKDFHLVVEKFPAVKNEVDEQLLQRLFFYQKLFLSRIKDKPEQRYKALIREHPEILSRIPQHYIASFLGITSVSLSRIRNRR